jgi:hypothetical protein
MAWNYVSAKVVWARAFSSCSALWASDEKLRQDFLCFSDAASDHMDSERVPVEPGLYVWEGQFGYDPGGYDGSGDFSDADFCWDGDFRPANAYDLAAAGLWPACSSTGESLAAAAENGT